MALFENCLLASDIDGTLVENGSISPRNAEAIKFFINEGGTFVLSTGRSASALKQIFGLLDKELVGPCAVLNGGMIYDFEKDKPLYASELKQRTKSYIKEVYKNLPNIGIEVHSDNLIYVIRKTYETEFHEDYELLDREYVTFEEIEDKPWNKVLYTCDNEAERQELATLLNSLDNGDCNLVPTEVVVEGIHHLYFEQMPLGITKAKGLFKLCKMLGIKKGGLFAIGDYYNDKEMLESADISATPSAAPEELKNLVNFVGGRCLDGAVADFIEYLSKSEVKK